MTSEFTTFTYSVYNALGVGYKNAMTRKELCEKLRCSDRLLRRAIEVLRRKHPILTRYDGSGYYLASTDAEGVQDTLFWLRRQNRRLRSIKESELGAIRFAGNRKKFQVPGQMDMFGGDL